MTEADRVMLVRLEGAVSSGLLPLSAVFWVVARAIDGRSTRRLLLSGLEALLAQAERAERVRVACEQWAATRTARRAE